MNYREHLLQPLSLRYIDMLESEILINPADFPLVYSLIFDADVKVAWRAAWACQKISEKHPDWFTENHFLELSTYAISISHGGILRGCLSILKNIEFPSTISVEFINSCFDWMVSPKQPIAVQALSMKILYLICIKIPDFAPELKVVLQHIDYENYSPGFICTRNKILKLLK